MPVTVFGDVDVVSGIGVHQLGQAVAKGEEEVYAEAEVGGIKKGAPSREAVLLQFAHAGCPAGGSAYYG